MNRAPLVYVPMAGWKLGRWALLYLVMLLADAAVAAVSWHRYRRRAG